MTSTEQNTIEVDLGGHTVTVPAGGLFDRFRMDTDLDEVARDPRVSGVDFFRTLPKNRVESRIGPTLTPNFYYAMSSARLTMIAPSKAIRNRIPRELAPLEIAPGIGLVSVMFFRYDSATSTSTPRLLWGLRCAPPVTANSPSRTSRPRWRTTTSTRTCSPCR